MVPAVASSLFALREQQEIMDPRVMRTDDIYLRTGESSAAKRGHVTRIIVETYVF